MTIIDSQVHAYEANTPKRPWHTVPNWPDHVTGDEMVAAMDKVGVDGAIFISAFSMYRYDASYAVEVQRAHPGRFAIVKPVDPDDPAVADVVADWKNTPGTVGIRIILTKEAEREPDDPGLDRILGAAVRHDFPVNLLCWGNLDAGTALIDRHPDTRFIIDHLGILQPRTPPAPPQPWSDLPKVLADRLDWEGKQDEVADAKVKVKVDGKAKAPAKTVGKAKDDDAERTTEQDQKTEQQG